MGGFALYGEREDGCRNGKNINQSFMHKSILLGIHKKNPQYSQFNSELQMHKLTLRISVCVYSRRNRELKANEKGGSKQMSRP